MNMQEKINKIMDIMNNIEYGFKDEKGKNILNYDLEKWNNDFEIFYYLQSPDELLKSKCGVCWDQVELERKLFLDNNIDICTYFVFIDDKNMLPSHTFLTFKNGKYVYWFEHSWAKYKGIHKYDNKSDLLKDIINKFKDDHPEINTHSKIYLYEYQKPKNHISCNEFYKYIETQQNINIR